MDVYTFKKIPGGSTISKNELGPYGIHPNEVSHVDITGASIVLVKVRFVTWSINVALHRVIIDEIDAQGASHTFEPGTSTAAEMQKMIMNVFNPLSNYLMP